MTQNILLAVADNIATITFNRPEVMNALDWDSIVRFREVCEEVQRMDAVRAVLLRGAGPAFLAGGDVAMFHSRLAQLPLEIVRGARELHYGIFALRRMEKPVVASVHGACAGAGFSVMLAADLVIAADTAQFNLAYSRIATSPDGGSTYFLPRMVGYHKAMELMLLSDSFDAQTAKNLGIVNFVAPAAELQAQTAQLMQRLAHGPSRAYAEAKKLVNDSFASSMEEQLEAEVQAFSRCTRTADLAQGVMAFVEKRKPVFTGK
ncbi:MAG: enoyl-CoA hydratase/isomerase family protein [Burkholderiales bacterium]